MTETDSGTLTHGSVSHGTPSATTAGAEQRALEVLIGKWINEGETVAGDNGEATPIVTSDVYDWVPGGFFVVHSAYGRIGDVGVGGIEVIGYDAASGKYQCQFFDSEGNMSTQELTLGEGQVTWEGEGTRCIGTFADDGRTLIAHHERTDDDGGWLPSMDVTLRRVD